MAQGENLNAFNGKSAANKKEQVNGKINSRRVY
jgi:hypothetical protein